MTPPAVLAKLKAPEVQELTKTEIKVESPIRDLPARVCRASEMRRLLYASEADSLKLPSIANRSHTCKVVAGVNVCLRPTISYKETRRKTPTGLGGMHFRTSVGLNEAV